MTNTQELGLLVQSLNEARDSLLAFVKKKYPAGSTLHFRSEFHPGKMEGTVLTHFPNGILVDINGLHKKGVKTDTILYERILE